MRDAAESAPAEGWGRGGAGEQGPGSLPTGAVHGPVCVRGTRVGAAALCACVCVCPRLRSTPTPQAERGIPAGVGSRVGGVRLPPRPPPPRSSSTVFPGGQGSGPAHPSSSGQAGEGLFLATWPAPLRTLGLPMEQMGSPCGTARRGHSMGWGQGTCPPQPLPGGRGAGLGVQDLKAAQGRAGCPGRTQGRGPSSEGPLAAGSAETTSCGPAGSGARVAVCAGNEAGSLAAAKGPWSTGRPRDGAGGGSP